MRHFTALPLVFCILALSSYTEFNTVLGFNIASRIAFTPSLSSNFTGPGTYQYYCQFHPSNMHGMINVFRTPDLNTDETVNIIDIATIAYSYTSTPDSQNWNTKT